MDHHVIEFICSFLILLAITGINHINLIEASRSIDPSHNTRIESPFYRSNNGSSRPNVQNGTYWFVGYKMLAQNGEVGVYSKTTLWSPNVIEGDWSASIIGIKSKTSLFRRGAQIELNAGWMVNPIKFHDLHPRIFASYKIGDDAWCYSYNPSCAVFVITNEHALVPLTNTSGTGNHVFMHVYITQNHNTQDWHLTVMVYDVTYEVGYWRSNAVLGLNGKAKTIMWGGKAYRSSEISSNPVPMMGSGKFKGYDETAYFRNMQIYDKEYQAKIITTNLKAYQTNNRLYKVGFVFNFINEGGAFQYGGPEIEESSS